MPTTTTTTHLKLAGLEVVGPDAAHDWRDRASCKQADPESFFPDKGGSTRTAKAVCASCAVRSECLDDAITNNERFGIWGGLSERERRRLKTSAGPAAANRDAAVSVA